MYKLFFIVLLFFLFSCSDSTKKKDERSTSLSKSNQNTKYQDAVDEEMQADILKEYENNYVNKVFLDSTVTIGSDIFRIRLKHSCLFDSSVVVPKKYVSLFGMDQFITHNFDSDLKVEKNGTIIINRMITKSDFNHLLDNNLKKYGVLLYPDLGIEDTSIQINYSISIPLTDVGVGVYVTFLNDSTLKYYHQE